jgi:isoleucyl-tRNA synthetase
VSRLAAPVAPFLSDWLHRALHEGESVHLAEFPRPVGGRDEALERGMEAVRRLATLGRAAREEIGVRVRQPLSGVYAVVPAGMEVGPQLLDILRDELNVRRVEFMEEAEELVTFSARPNFRSLGARLGKATPRVAQALRELTSEALAAFRRGEGLTVEMDGVPVVIGEGDLDIVQEARGEMAVQAEGGYTIALDAAITPELRSEGLARELVNRVQRLRKESGLEVSDRIRMAVAAEQEVSQAAEAHREFICGETLAVELEVTADRDRPRALAIVREVDLDGRAVTLGLEPVEGR